MNPAPLTVDVLPAKAEQFFGAKAGAGSEYGYGAIARVEVRSDRLYLFSRLEREYVFTLVALALRVADTARAVVLQ